MNETMNAIAFAILAGSLRIEVGLCADKNNEYIYLKIKSSM